jgi:hypothetical protein
MLGGVGKKELAITIPRTGGAMIRVRGAVSIGGSVSVFPAKKP